MAEPITVPRESEGRSLFVTGYFSDRFWKGEVPTYGYPKNHLPEPPIKKVEVVSGFIAALQAK